MDPIVFKYTVSSELPLARECVESFCCLLEKLGIVTARLYLHIVARGEAVDRMLTKLVFEVIAEVRTEHIGETITGADLGHVISDCIEAAGNPKGAAIDVESNARIVDVND